MHSFPLCLCIDYGSHGFRWLKHCPIKRLSVCKVNKQFVELVGNSVSLTAEDQYRQASWGLVFAWFKSYWFWGNLGHKIKHFKNQPEGEHVPKFSNQNFPFPKFQSHKIQPIPQIFTSFSRFSIFDRTFW